MKNKAGTILMILGAVLVILALSLFLHNQREAEKADEAAQAALQQVFSAIEERTSAPEILEEVQDEAVPEPGTAEETGLVTEADEDPYAMTVVEKNGVRYVGYLTIPELGLQLPVLAELEDANLQIGPCRYSGSTKSQDLVIGAHNYVRHFARIWRLQPGAQITFTDMDGVTRLYEVEAVETLSPAAVEEMTTSGYPLTLFTCTYTGNNRTAVRCVLPED